MDARAAWSAAAGVVTAVSGTNAVGWSVGAAAAHSPLPVWPAYVFGAMSLGGLYCVVAPLLRLWPFRGIRSVRELLDDYIRRGREARDRIIYRRLDDLAAAGEAAEWTLRTTNGLHARFPAITDAFLLAAGNHQAFSGQALIIQTMNAKLAVLTSARTGLGA
jgi:hypothetical protein